MSNRATLVRLMAPLLLVASASCLSTQDYGDPAAPAGDAPDGAAPDPTPIGTTPVADGTWSWQWINPSPTGRTLVGVGGTSDSDLWAVGEGGTISHFNGTAWDLRHVGKETTRYFSVGTRAPNDVWVAGTDGSQTSVVHYDGKDWLDSYPFAGGAFSAFSHGAGKRLFAVVDWEILELSADGKWASTDTSDNDVFGPPVDVWVSSTGDAWTMTSGAKLLYLPAGTTKWQLQAPVAGIPAQATGIAMSGAGAQACAFFTGYPNGVGGGGGFMHYDGAAWHVGPSSADNLLTIDRTPHPSRSACLTDGTGLIFDGTFVMDASQTSALAAHTPEDFEGESLLGAFSFDGKKAYAVGALGAFLVRSPGSSAWVERGPTTRKDLLGIDVGLDGAVMLVDALQPDRSSGGEVLFWKDSTLKTNTGGGFLGPSIPVAVTVVANNDAWVVSNDNSAVAITHWTGTWGITTFLEQGGDPLAIWAPAKDDIWVAAREHCPDFDPLPSGCSQKLAGSAWHYDGATWTEVAVKGAYGSIHGTGPNDVWFAGEGVAHWDGKALTVVPSLTGTFAGVWASAPKRVWLWGDKPVLFDGETSTPVEKVLNASAEWEVSGIAESVAGDVFVLTKRATGTSLLWFDRSHTKLTEQITSDLALTAIRGREDQLWAIGSGGASLRFAPPSLR